MKMIVDIQQLGENIVNAGGLTNCHHISLMLKSFYEGVISPGVCALTGRTFAMTPLKGIHTVCYSVGDFQRGHDGTIVTSTQQFAEAYKLGIHEFYIPVNMFDDREGISSKEAKILIDRCIYHAVQAHITGPVPCLTFILMVTSGCLNDRHPSLDEIADMAASIPDAAYVSVGGSFYLQFPELPRCIQEIRIGEYVLFGTIPYCDQVEKFGRPAVKVEMDVIQTYPERQHILVRGGYSEIDTKDCFMLTGGLEYVDSSSEYTIYRDRFRQFEVGDKVVVIPNYKSLVKLRHVERIFA